MDTTIHFSRGTNKFDNYPEMRSAANFDTFTLAIFSDCGQRKGETWFAAPFNHDGRRCRDNVQPRRFLALDFDHIEADRLPDLRMWLAAYSAFGYTTSSNTLESPRERAVLELTREVTRAEGIQLNKALASDLHDKFGDAIKLDEAAFKGEQPIYNPLSGFQRVAFDGAPLDVDAVLAAAPEVNDEPTAAPHVDGDIPEGARSTTLTSFAGSMRRRGMTEESIAAALLEENKRCVPPLSDADVRAIARSVAGYQPYHDAYDQMRRRHREQQGHGDRDHDEEQAEHHAVRGYLSRQVSEIQAVPIHWLWQGRIARGKVSMIAGNPGLGKSQITLSIAAITSTGGAWPVDRSHCEPGNVIILSAEDDAADTLRPRLDAAGANLERIFVLDAVREANGAQRPFNLKKDLAQLDTMIEDTKDVALVIIDPITAYLGDIDSHVNAEVRGLLSPVGALAAKHDTAILAVSHFSKGGGEAILRITGSLAFVAAVRSAYVVTKDKDDDDRRLLLALKNNIASDNTGFAFTLESAEVKGVDCLISTSRVAWEQEFVTTTADEAMSKSNGTEERGAVGEAAEFLRNLLAGGPMGAREVRLAAEEAGFAWRTVRRAQEAVRVVITKAKGANGAWFWSLPPAEDRDDDLGGTGVDDDGDVEVEI